MNDLSNIKVGESLYHLQRGWLKVYKLMPDCGAPIVLEGFSTRFTFDGKESGFDRNPILFLSEVVITNFPTAKLKTDDLIEVWSNMEYACTGTFKRRRFSHFDGAGQACCFGFGQSSSDQNSTVSAWDNWQPLQD